MQECTKNIPCILEKSCECYRFIRNGSGATPAAATTAAAANRRTLSPNGTANREARTGNNSICSSSLRSSPPAHNATSGQKVELQAIVSADHPESGVTTALVPQTAAASPALNGKLESSVAHKVTVDVVGEKHCKVVVKCDEKSALLQDNSTNCEECCRSCSCGDTISSGEEESSFEGVNEDNNGEKVANKSSAATQTPQN